MSTKTNINLNEQNVFLAKIQLIIDTLDEIDKIINEIPNERSQIDMLLSDYYHIMENYELDEKGAHKLSKLIHDARAKRRNLDNIYRLSNTYNTHKSKITSENARVFFRTEMNKCLKNLNEEYKNRVLSEEDTKDILNNVVEKTISKETTRKKRKSLTEFEIESIKKALNDGVSPKELSVTFGTCIANIYRIRKVVTNV